MAEKVYKIYSYLDQLADAYKEPIQLTEGLPFNHKQTLATIEFYSNDQYTTGNKDELQKEKPFFNICNFRVTTAKTATDLDVKDIKYEPDSLKDSVPTMLINHELFKYLKETNFSNTLNEMGKTRPKYGGLLIKKVKKGDQLMIEVVDWKNVDCDPVSILGAPLIETHYMEISNVADKADVWYNVEEFITAHAKANKNKPVKMEVREITGTMPVAYDPSIETPTEKEMTSYKTMCVYVGVVNKKKFYLYSEDVKSIRDKYRYLAWERVPGRGLGRGVVEDGFEAQVWTNDTMISMKNAMELAGKVILHTTSKKVSGNAITDMLSGHIIELEDGKTIDALNLMPSAMPQFERIVELWKGQYNNSVSTYAANTGEAPTAGTPYSQTALLNQVANTPFEYQREVWGIFLNEILNDWILPHLKKRILKKHYLVSEFDEEELKMIDATIKAREGNSVIKDKLLNDSWETPAPSATDVMAMDAQVDQQLSQYGNKREVEIPEKFLDIEGRITANITGELKNKAVMLQSLSQVMKDAIASFNPQTGTFAVFENPVLSKLFGMIIEMSGIPFSSAQLKPSGTKPVQMADPSAIRPVTPANGQSTPKV